MGLLVAIEGLDAAGKRTQTELLLERAAASGRRASALSFPRYGETRFAAAAADYLAGRYGRLEAVDPHLAALVFAGDRFESRELLERGREASDLLVLDRYVPSNVAYQGARVPDERLDAFAEWLERIEHGVYGLPRPDVVLLLDVPPEAAAAARASRGRAEDIHERDAAYLARVRGVYDRLARRDGSWRVVPCGDGGGLLPRETIHERVWAALAPALAQSP